MKFLFVFYGFYNLFFFSFPLGIIPFLDVGSKMSLYLETRYSKQASL